MNSQYAYIVTVLGEIAGVLQPPEMRHANDASRQALYTGFCDAYIPNPLR